jgi:hypothetical protein
MLQISVVDPDPQPDPDNFLRDPELEVMDPAPELDMNHNINHQKNYHFDN